jgi:hypothetical protein
MSVDASSTMVIRRPREVVASFVAEPDNAPAWYVNIRSVKWMTPPPLQVGSRLQFIAHFMGSRMMYTYEVTELDPGRRMVMRTTTGPFPMETIYEWESIPEGTRMTLRNRGGPSGVLGLVSPLLEWSVRRANRKDLARLKQVLEAAPL